MKKYSGPQPFDVEGHVIQGREHMATTAFGPGAHVATPRRDPLYFFDSLLESGSLRAFSQGALPPDEFQYWRMHHTCTNVVKIVTRLVLVGKMG